MSIFGVFKIQTFKAWTASNGPRLLAFHRADGWRIGCGVVVKSQCERFFQIAHLQLKSSHTLILGETLAYPNHFDRGDGEGT